MMIETILIISIVVNIFFIFYLRWILKNFSFLSENVYNLLETVQAFSDHLSAINELEMYYGDQTIQNLIIHSQQVVSDIELYRDVYTITIDEDKIEDVFNEEEAEEEK